jgi:hypothetical protein
MNPLHPQEQASMRTWAEASAQASAKASAVTQEDVDHASVESHLNQLAYNGQLRIIRCFADGGRIARHKVLILEEEDGEVVSTDIGGHASMAELKRGAHGGTDWLYTMERLGEDWVRIDVMITDCFPDIPMFRRLNGSKVDLGFNDDEHYYLFSVAIRENDLVDMF